LIEAFCRLTKSAGEHEQNQEDVKEIHEYAPCLGLAARVSLNHGAVSMITPDQTMLPQFSLGCLSAQKDGSAVQNQCLWLESGGA
jgi:hypothetical protein